jgi:hypothetical protein
MHVLDRLEKSVSHRLQPGSDAGNRSTEPDFLHFAMVAIALLKALLGGLRAGPVLAGAAVYSVFAVWFGLVVFTHPEK